jgi:carboxyl-terminal processing protease
MFYPKLDEFGRIYAWHILDLFILLVDKEERSTYKIIQPLMLSACIAVGMMLGYKMNDMPENNLISALDYPTDSIMMTGRVEELIRFVENKYVDSLDGDKLISEALAGVFSQLDPHSVYLSPSETVEVNDQMDGNYSGIGIENFMLDDTVQISNVLPGSPAEKSGLKIFDKVITIDKKQVAGQKMDYSDIKAMLKKHTGTDISLSVLRDGKVMNMMLTVAEVEVKTVHAVWLKDIQTVLLKIDRFGDNTYKEFMTEVEKYFTNKQAQHIILDLRDNPGGFLPEATNILCQIFEEKDKLLLYTEGRNKKRNEYKSNGKRFFNIDQVVVLIDENSASASEIVAGAIQDWDRGVVIGRRSFGKGLVQEQYNLTNGGAIRLTVARYFTPSGRSIQRDYSDKESYHHDFEDRQSHGDLFDKDSTLIKNGGKYYTKLYKRPVSGAGGVSPDVFVAMDTIYRHYNYFSFSYLIPEFAFQYTSKNKSKIPKTPSDFEKWQLPDSFSAELKAFIDKEHYEKQDFSHMNHLGIKNDVKKYVRKYLFERNNLSNPDLNDPFVVEASRVIKNKLSPKSFIHKVQ